MKAKEIWGQCKYRKLQHNTRLGYYYICEKSRTYCHPNYCLGPDEDKKGESDEEREDH